jgi:UDP-glucose 4-epimerase
LPLFLRTVRRGEIPTVHGDGGDLRDLLYVADAARAVALAVERNVEGAFNVSDGEPHTIAEIARTAMKVAKLSGDPGFGPRVKPRLDYHMSIDRARRLLGFSPDVSLERGMEAQYAEISGNAGESVQEHKGSRRLPQTP